MSIGTLLLYGAGAAAMVWLVVRMARRAAAMARWHREKQPCLRYYLASLLLPLAVWISPLFLLAPEMPVAQEQLITEQGVVTAYQTNTRKTNRYGLGTTYLEGLYLDDSQICSYLPGRRIEPEEILSRLGLGDVTLQYSLDRSGRHQIYTLTTSSGVELLSYEQVAEIRWRDYEMSMLCLVCLLLAGIGWALGLPPRLLVNGGYDGAEDDSATRLKSVLLLLGYLALIFLVLWTAAHPGATVHTRPACTAVDVDGAVQVCLPGEWTKDEGWYCNRQDVILRIYADVGETPQEWGLTPEEWYGDYFSSLRTFHLESFLRPGEWVLFESWEPVQLQDGQSGRVAQGYGESENGLRSLIIAAAFPREGVAVRFQVSAWDLESEELEEYAQENVLPVIPYLEFTA